MKKFKVMFWLSHHNKKVLGELVIEANDPAHAEYQAQVIMFGRNIKIIETVEVYG